MRLIPPDKFSIVVLGSRETGWLKERLARDIEAGKMAYIDREAQPEEARRFWGGEDYPEGPVAVVLAEGEEEGEACVLSAIGQSLIVHCEDQVIPLRRAAETEPPTD